MAWDEPIPVTSAAPPAAAGLPARWAALSVAVAVATIALKTAAWALTGSVGLLSDAAESLVNLAGAVMALWMLRVAARPADEEHAYGHSKAEYFASAFEGALIVLAAFGITLAAISRLVSPQPLERLGIGGSRCPHCGSPVRWIHNVPVLSWVALRGRCASCGARIGWQYPAVELATAAIWAGHAGLWGWTPRALSGAVLLTLLLAIAIIDARHFVIPDELSLGGLAVGFLLSMLPGPPTVPESVIGSIVGGGLLWLVALVGSAALGREAMGGGDIKLMAMLGAFLGWQGALLTVFLGALIGTLVFLPIAWRSERLVPFGVFLALGAATDFYLGDALLAWYFG